MSARFEHLPLVDVSTRVTFGEPLPFGLAFIGALRDVIRHPDYTDVEDLDEIQSVPGLRYLNIPSQLGVVGGVKFVAPAKGLAIVLQPDVAIVQWKKSFALDAVEYPYHEEMISTMRYLLESIQTAAGMEALPTIVSNIGYTKLIETDPGTAKDTIGRYYKDNLWVGAMMGAERLHEANYSWRQAEGIDLRFHLRYAETHIDGNNKQGYMVSDVAGMVLAGKDPIVGLTEVHDVLLDFFEQSLSDTAKAEWGYSNG